jgi:hypothetical protein
MSFTDAAGDPEQMTNDELQAAIVAALDLRECAGMAGDHDTADTWEGALLLLVEERDKRRERSRLNDFLALDILGFLGREMTAEELADVEWPDE